MTLLRETGEALYGAPWQTPLSRDIDVSDRTMRRWAADSDHTMSPGVAADLIRLCEERVLLLEAVIERLRATSGT